MEERDFTTKEHEGGKKGVFRAFPGSLVENKEEQKRRERAESSKRGKGMSYDGKG